MKPPVIVHVAASPRLLHDLIKQGLDGGGIELTESERSLVAVVTADHSSETHSRIVIVLGESTEGDVHILIDDQPIADRPIAAGELRGLVLDLAGQLLPPGDNPAR